MHLVPQAPEFIIVSQMAQVLADNTLTKRTIELRLSGLEKLMLQVRGYREHGYSDAIVSAVAEKKGNLILETKAKSEMERILNPRAPQYDGNRFIPDEYSIPEEELIAWCETFKNGPLTPEGTKRYMELFEMLFPKEASKYFWGIE